MKTIIYATLECLAALAIFAIFFAAYILLAA